MKVIIKKTGKIKEVSEGYARNYLLPRGVATPANAAAVQELATQQKQNATTEAAQKRAWDAQAEKISSLQMTVHAKANSEGVLFGSLPESVILDTLRTHGVEIEPSWLRISEPIKRVGPARVSVAFPHGVNTTLNILVNAE